MLKIVAPGPQPPGTQTGAPDELPSVLLVVDQLAKTLGGGERILLKLAAMLPHSGFRAAILTFSAHPESPALASPPCPIYLLPLNSTYNFRALLGAFEFRQLLRRERIRIVQTFFESSDIYAGLLTKTLSSARLIWARRDMGILRTGKHRLTYRLMAGLPDAVFAVSEQVRRHAIAVDRIDPERVHTVYNGLDAAELGPPAGSPKAAGELTVATVGNIRRVKGHDVLLKAAAAVCRQFPSVRFSIGGEVLEPAYFAELQTLVQDLRLGAHVRFAGGVTDLRAHLAAVDLFVLPSRSEGFSNAILEAMAASLPVIATDVGGNAEAVADGTSGFLVPADDPESLAAAIVKLLSDPNLRRTMGEAARRRVEAEFTIETMMGRVTDVYRKVLGGR